MTSGNEGRKTADMIDGRKLKEMIKFAASMLEKKKSLIDSLNVFPVPDGDTGTNMSLTMKEALEEIKGEDCNHAGEICQSLSRGALMGARGNSGVILSQLLRGFAQVNEENQVIESEDFVNGLEEASRVAYKGVLKPVEGTILTVSRRAAEGARDALEETDDLVKIMRQTHKIADKALNKTPEQLPVLKEADVVDAGGQGLVFIFEGMLRSLEGEKVETADAVEEAAEESVEISADEIIYTYCTQMLIKLEDDNGQHEVEKIRSELNNYGDSLMVVGADNIVKVHIHTDHPGVVLEYGLKLGMLEEVNIDNMELQQEQSHEDFVEIQKERQATASGMELNSGTGIKEVNDSTGQEEKKRGVIAVVSGEGIREILKQLGVDRIIHGGQSMNPSTNELLSALEEIPAGELIVFPNNKNIISAARQAAELCSEKDVKVIPTENFTEAVASMMLYGRDQELADLASAMKKELKKIKTLEVTEAVKDSNVRDLSIEEGEVIGLIDGDIKTKGSSYENVVLDLLEDALEDEDLITIFYGEEIDEEQALDLRKRIEERFCEGLEVEIYEGGQPLYPYIISLE